MPQAARSPGSSNRFLRRALAIPTRSIRSSVVAGFFVILAIWLVTTAVTLRRLSTLESESLRVAEQFRVSQRILVDLRIGLLTSSLSLRDAMLERDTYAGLRLGQARTELQGLLVKLADDPALAADVARLRGVEVELDAMWTTMSTVLAGEPTGREVMRLLRDEVAPRRSSILARSRELSTIIQRNYYRYQDEAAAAYRVVYRRIAVASALVFGAVSFVALLVVRRTGRLEREVQQQQVAAERAAEDLKRLSAKLVKVEGEERRRIARDLHDFVGQSITAVKLDIARAELALPPNDEAVQWLTEARLTADQALTSVRELSQLLHPSLLDDLGLAPALESLLRQLERQTGMRTAFTQTGVTERVAPDIERAAFRIAQECAHNVVRHARASSCALRLHRDTTTVRLDIEDDGVGFEPAEHASGAHRRGLGLLGMEERARELGGRVHVESAPGRGTRVRVQIPLTGSEAPSTDAGGDPAIDWLPPTVATEGARSF